MRTKMAPDDGPPLVGLRDDMSDASEDTALLSQSRKPARYGSFEAAFDQALERLGLGGYHVLLVLVCGWALASDSVEIQCISFVTPQLDAGGDAGRDTGGNQVNACLLSCAHLHPPTADYWWWWLWY